MSLHLFNSLTRRVEAFVPADPARVTMYVCGPTVYNYVHIGNARPYVVFGVLADLLRRRYGALSYARNVTDVDDKINNAAREQGVPISVITDKFAAAYREDMASLGIAPPDIEPEVTAHIPQIIAMIQQLIANEHAYEAQNHVLFSVASFDSYGKLSRRDPEEMLAGARVEVAPYKRDAGDFVLWKPSTDDLPGWDSPWGRGRPGWHIECSAMAAAHLGETIDIHAGGVDLQFPHHENEIAQSECAHGGRIFARYWLHNGMLTFGGTKMSKSLGNIEKIHDLVRAHPPEALRYALLSAHYRQPLDWSDALIEQSVRTLDRLYGALRDTADLPAVASAIPQEIERVLDNDLNTPMALSEISALADSVLKHTHLLRTNEKHLALATKHKSLTRVDARLMFVAWIAEGLLPAEVLPSLEEALNSDPDSEVDAAPFVRSHLQQWADSTKSLLGETRGRLLGAGLALGLLQQDPAAWFARGASSDDDARIQGLIDERAAAKKARDFARADAIRDQLFGEGILLEDTPQGVRWKRG
ncbi:cysteine--tRNA ligase [Lysobacter solisilvae (ex Woo and Kim 2022)]|uniref:Cysteine--tRNA ligase n=1 Tax=Agrilutibacter terrestris TaxID=2865112 RepID=A0A7H0FWP1_9GAMM|nr:cysteine--tRNA ligase [Lysobacter terrestris]QNP40457.1 cysteine--tRNA ligase [Lysobacter terrestris]